MKKRILLLGFFSLGISALKAQSTVTGHVWLAGRHIGFNASNGTNPLLFRTNALDRMALMGTNPVGSISGALGLGTITPLSFLHVSNFTTGAFSPNGNLFRTDGISTVINQWQFFTGATAAASSQKFRAFTTTGTLQDGGTVNNINNITLEASQRDMIFNAGGNIERMRILGQDHNLNGITPWFATALAGNVGIGNNHPMSMLQIGGDAASGAGWRPWMTIGTQYASEDSFDNMYVGLRNISNDVNEAIINWGNNPSTAPNNADRLRFVFTAAAGNATASTLDGLEIARMWANNLGDGRMGIGDFFTPGLDPQNTVEIRPSTGSPYWASSNGTSGLRFSSMLSSATPIANPGAGVLSVDVNGDVIYVDAGTSGGGLSPNFGAPCLDPVNGVLSANSKVNLNNNNFYFEDNDLLGLNHVGIGVPCGNTLFAKLTAVQSHPTPVSANTIGFIATNTDIANTPGQSFTGSSVATFGFQNPALMTSHTAGSFFSANASSNFGVFSIANSISNPSSTNIAGIFRTSGQTLNATAGLFNGSGGTTVNYGIQSTATGGANAYGVWAGSVNNSTVGEWALWVNGDANCTGTAWGFSDSTLKQNITEDQGALTKLLRLRPVNYDMRQTEYPYANLASGLQHGFISQEVETIFPELVRNITRAAQYDSLGNELSPALTVKGLNYNGIISLNTQAIKELHMTMGSNTLSDQTIKTNVNDLSGSLDKVLEMRGVTYDWNPGAMDSLNLDTCTHIGFIAQEINAIDPLLTFMDDHNLMNVDYSKVVPVAVEAIQELNSTIEEQQEVIDSQQVTINDLNNRLTDLENCLSGILPYLCQLNNSAIQPTEELMQEKLRSIIDVQLSNKNSIVLNQNVPNPFAESTVITYSVPAAVQRAQIHFYDMSGKLINSVDISERGEGQLNVYANDLSSGIYTYSLVADGKVVSTKKMMKN